MNTKSIAWLCAGVMLLLCANAFARDVTVNCAKKNQSIGAALALLPAQGPHTIRVSGQCHEAVVIDRRDDLTLVGLDGASIYDPTPEVLDDNNVVSISESSRIRLQNLKIYGGLYAVACFSFSSCRLIGLEVAGAAAEGVAFSRSRGWLQDGTVIRDCGAGLSVYSQSTVLMSDFVGRSSIRNSSAGVGVRVQDNSVLLLTSTDVTNNPLGITALLGGEFRLQNVTVTGGGTGVQLSQGGLGQFSGVTITGNAADGVRVGQLSFARFVGSSVVGNGSSTDINCASATAATQGAIDASVGQGGTTNCTDAP